MIKILLIILILMFSTKSHNSQSHHSTKILLNKLVDSLVDRGIIKTPKVSQVMRLVDRADYYHGYGAYQDTPQLIGCHATISAPHMHAYCLVRLLNFI
jgi:protein-L-isoaspartate O-methyltransferase